MKILLIENGFNDLKNSCFLSALTFGLWKRGFLCMPRPKGSRYF